MPSESKQWADMLPSEQRRQLVLDLRGVESAEELCPGCGGAGTKAYGSTATWMGGIGGQTITSGICDKCWGSGVKAWTGVDGRKARAAMRNTRTPPPWAVELARAVKSHLDKFEHGDPPVWPMRKAYAALPANVREAVEGSDDE